MDIKCEYCTKAVAKYKCPRCLMQTCSLPCVKAHKEQFECSGQRDKTKYVSIKNFDDVALLSDYRFLEEAYRKCDSAERDMANVRFPRPFFIEKMQREARLRGVDMHLLPNKSTKRRGNKTRYFTKQRELVWHLELNFPKASAKYDAKSSDTNTLKEALAHYIDPESSDPVIRQNLQLYTARWPDNIHVFMKVERCRANEPRYYQLQLNETIADNLKGKMVIEYPILTVVTKEDIDKYPLYVKDQEYDGEDPEIQTEYASTRKRSPPTERSSQQDVSDIKRSKIEDKTNGNAVQCKTNNNYS